ncbi:alpha/beta hydrolase [Novosphingobium sp.]|uniref:alpha/beta hydrolase n=1 Tax=Novosphingobium sp. TaxID=1874826 RepID=UPI0038BCA320
MTGTLALASAAFALAAAPPAMADPAPAISAAAALGHPSQVSIADTKRIDFVSSVNGRRYSIDVALPDMPPPPGGYPVIYVLDGYGYFASVVEAARGNGNSPDLVVVGIGYPHDAAWFDPIIARHQPLPPMFASAPRFSVAAAFERQRDLSLAADDTTISGMKASGVNASASDFDGLDGFLQTIETDVKPRVAALTAINQANQTLFGHSLGGLAVLQALFTEPTAFHNFVAASPSIWWSNKLVLAGEARFSAAVNSGKASPRVLIEVGELEETMPDLPPEMASKKAEIEAGVKGARMVGNACDLADRLKSLHGANGYTVSGCITFPGQNHGISVWPAIGQAIAFVARH